MGEIEELRAENLRLQQQVALLQKQLQLQNEGQQQRLDKVDKNFERGNSDSQKYISHGLDPYQVRRYSRQLLVPSFGIQGQEKLLQSSVLVIGCGGLGSSAALYLAAAGVGCLGLVDRDTVELNNLHRQIIHTEGAIGTPKVKSASAACRAINSSLKILEYYDGFNARNALEIVSKYDVVVDATDNLPTRYLISDACVVAGKPLVSGAALGMDGQLTIYNQENGPCYRCLFPVPPPQSACQRCSDSGVLGVVPGIIGCLEALEAIKLAAALGEPLSSRMLIFDALSTRFQAVKLRGKSPVCVACGENPQILASNFHNLNYEEFTGVPMTDEAPVRKQVVSLSNAISCTQLKQHMDEGEPHILLDVRDEHQYAISALSLSTNIPFSQLHKRLQEVQDLVDDDTEKQRSLYVICRRGNDSQRAVGLLRNAGLNAMDVTGGLESWGKEAMVQSVPIIDLSAFFEDESEDGVGQRRKDVLQEVGKAAQEWGFFQVLNHGLDTRLLECNFASMKEFFELPLEEKLKVKPAPGSSPVPTGYNYNELTQGKIDKKEHLLWFFEGSTSRDLAHPFSQYNVWPEANPHTFRPTVEELVCKLEKTAYFIMDVISESLGIPANFIHDQYKEKTNALAFFKYPPSLGEPHEGNPPHSDANVITLLAQNEVAGLQVLKQGKWIPVEPVKGSLVVNIADSLQVWSNNRLKSVMHRVVNHETDTRYSLVFFCTPGMSTCIRPWAEFTTNIQEKPKYRPFYYGEYLQHRFQNKRLSEDGKFIWIDHYAV